MMKHIWQIFTVLCFLFISNASAEPLDFTGFWKQSCDDSAGLQIKAYKDRMYNINFCGPGGDCNEPPNLRTAINIEADPEYEVINPTTIKIIYSKGYTPTYIKCTSDTNPKLEYSEASKAEGRIDFLIALVFHLGYFLLAIIITLMLWRRIHNHSKVIRTIYRTALLSILFSPGMYYSFPFICPTFALLALLAQLYSVAQGFTLFLLPQLIYSLVPMCLTWLLLSVGSLIIIKYRHKE